nr:MAG TPA: hypothetical protein [Bacteriophage sp.]
MIVRNRFYYRELWYLLCYLLKNLNDPHLCCLLWYLLCYLFAYLLYCCLYLDNFHNCR